jgi:hypothetical protein
MPRMRSYDLCLTWYWLHDHDFADFIQEACSAYSVTLWQITPFSILQAVNDLYSEEAVFYTLLDRATDDLRFEPIRRFALEHSGRRLNPPELSHWSEDKATMHLELIQAGLYTPYTIILSPFIFQPILPTLNLAPLGPRFVLKPAVGGGGEGVTMNASSIDDIRRARLEFPDQKYLVQEQVQARTFSGREAWFRIFYVGGACIPCWWHPVTHIYGVLTPQQESEFELGPLRSLTEKIAQVCRLDWFSTEIALTLGGRYVVVDYVNDGIDTRIQSKAADGMPDEVMRQIADGLVRMAIRGPKP